MKKGTMRKPPSTDGGSQGRGTERRTRSKSKEKTQLMIVEAPRGRRKDQSGSKDTVRKMNATRRNSSRLLSRSRSRDKEADLKGSKGVKIKLELMENEKPQKIPAQKDTSDEEVISISSTEVIPKKKEVEEVILTSGSEEESSGDMEIDPSSNNQDTEKEEEGNMDDEEEESSNKDYSREEKDDMEMMISENNPTATVPKKNNGNVDFGADDSDDEDKYEEELETGGAEMTPKLDNDKKRAEEKEKDLYTAWNKVSRRALVKVEGNWFDIYDTDLLNPLPSPTKKFIKDFNKTHKGKTPPVKHAKTTKKNGRSGLALNLYGSPRGRGVVNETTNIGETTENQVMAPVTPEKSQNKEDSTTDEAGAQKKQTQTTTKTQQKLSYKTVANQCFQEATASDETFEPVLRKQSWRFNIAFNVQEKIDGQNNSKRQEKALQNILFQVLTEGQRIDPSFGIRPWKSNKPYPTVYDPRDAHTITYERLVHYLRAPVQGYGGIKQIMTGRNYKWRIFATFNDAEQDTFAERLTKAVINRITIKDFPRQMEQAWPVGFCMGSTENQDIRQINAKLEELTGVEGAQASFQNVYQRDISPSLWKEAEERAKVGLNPREVNRIKHAWAPAAIMIFVPNRSDVGKARKMLYESFGANVEDKHGNKDAYLVWPGGAQMKFVPCAENRMSDSNRTKIGRRLIKHMTMKGNAKIIRTMVSDLDIRLECLKGKTLGETILAIMTPDKTNPIFRHFQEDWRPHVHQRKSYSLVTHSVFIKDAEKAVATLKNVLVDEYGEEVLQGFSDGTRGLNNDIPTYGTDLDDKFDLEIEENEDDKFMSQKIKYKFNNTGVVEMNKTVAERSPFLDKGGDLIITHNLDKSVAFSTASDRTNAIARTEQGWETVSYKNKNRNKKNNNNKTGARALPSILKKGGTTDNTVPTAESSQVSSITGSTEEYIDKKINSDGIQKYLLEGKLNENELWELIKDLVTQGAAAAEEPNNAK